MKIFPHYTQQESADCGPTCLRMIAEYYGKTYSAEMLRRHCYISREGVSMLGISDAAEYIGFHTIGVRISFDQLMEEGVFPCILHWNQNHFVVCYGVKKMRKDGEYKIYISDPASHRLTYTSEEFKHCWLSTRNGGHDCGVALMLEPGPNFGKRDEEVVVGKKSLFSFVRYFLPYKSLFMQLLAGMCVGSLLQLIFPFLTQAMVDYGIGQRSLSLITLILIAQLVLFVAQLSVDYIRSWDSASY